MNISRFQLIRSSVYILILAANPAFADENSTCKLSFVGTAIQSENDSELLIRSSALNTQAILISKYGTRVFECTESILDTYECYGFTQSPGEMPTQLNILDGGIEAGTIVVEITLNFFFLKNWAEGEYSPDNFDTRRFSVDSYIIKSCEHS